MFPMSPDDHILTNGKQSLIRSKQTPDYSATTFGRSIKKDGGKRIYQDGSIL
jgi:hypothetical protein